LFAASIVERDVGDGDGWLGLALIQHAVWCRW